MTELNSLYNSYHKHRLLSTAEILLHQVCNSESSARLGLRRVIFDDVMSYNSLTTLLISLTQHFLTGLVSSAEMRVSKTSIRDNA